MQPVRTQSMTVKREGGGGEMYFVDDRVLCEEERCERHIVCILYTFLPHSKMPRVTGPPAREHIITSHYVMIPLRADKKRSWC